jgi:hypothetical protein
LIQQEFYTEPAAANELPQNRFGHWYVFGGTVGNVDPKVTAVVTEWHRLSLTTCVGGEDDYAIVVDQRRRRIADELIPVQVRKKLGVEPVRADELAKWWHLPH